VLERLAAEDIPALLASGAVAGGMLAKLRAVEEAVAGGLSQVRIANGHRAEAWEALFSEEETEENAAGTVIVSSLPVEKRG
jgi:acetylglutamate kinase